MSDVDYKSAQQVESDPAFRNENGDLACPECGQTATVNENIPFNARGLVYHRARVHGKQSPTSGASRSRKHVMRRRRNRTSSRTQVMGAIDALAADEKAAEILYVIFPDGIPTHDSERLLRIIHLTDGLRNELRGI